jgi:hypothetical protein
MNLAMLANTLKKSWPVSAAETRFTNTLKEAEPTSAARRAG